MRPALRSLSARDRRHRPRPPHDRSRRDRRQLARPRCAVGAAGRDRRGGQGRRLRPRRRAGGACPEGGRRPHLLRGAGRGGRRAARGPRSRPRDLRLRRPDAGRRLPVPVLRPRPLPQQRCATRGFRARPGRAALRAAARQRHEPPRPEPGRPRRRAGADSAPRAGARAQPSRLRRRARSPAEPAPGRDLRPARRPAPGGAPEPRRHRRHPARRGLPPRPDPPRHRPLRRPPLRRREACRHPVAAGHPGPRRRAGRDGGLRRRLDRRPSQPHRPPSPPAMPTGSCARSAAETSRSTRPAGRARWSAASRWT